MSRLFLASLIAATMSFQTPPKQGHPIDINSAGFAVRLGNLRSMPDAERAKETRALATDIRAMKASVDKLQLAMSLGNLSTEGYFGEGTLQEVTNTIVGALKELPDSKNTDPAYDQLAGLKRVEGMDVDVDNAKFTAALDKIDKQTEVRANADFELKDINGKSWKRSKLKGKVVWVNFWATWCPPCRKEMPDMQAFYDKYKDKGLVILAISDEKPEVVQKFLDEKKYNYPVLIDDKSTVHYLYQIGGIPNSFIYNKKGEMVAQSLDMRTKEQMEKMLAKAGLE